MLNALLAGLTGACAVTLMNEIFRRFDQEAPRLDLLGMRALARVASPDDLRTTALVSAIATDSVYYAMVGGPDPDKAPACGLALGVAAGLGAVLLPGPLGLGGDTTTLTRKTQILSVAYYTTGGLLAGCMYRALADRSDTTRATGLQV